MYIQLKEVKKLSENMTFEESLPKGFAPNFQSICGDLFCSSVIADPVRGIFPFFFVS